MAHKTLVNGTVYEVGGGKTLIDGVAYSIDKGKTLVGGTAYEVGFGPPLVTVKLTSYEWDDDSHTSGTNCMINGVTYYAPDTGVTEQLSLPVGTEILLKSTLASNSYGLMVSGGDVYINGAQVVDSTFYNQIAEYTYVVTTNATICFEFDRDSSGQRYSEIHITEQ